jgi:hypothetical protein
MVTTEDMRIFSLECLKWADETKNPSDRDIMLRVARMWMKTAAAIDRQVHEGNETVADPRIKFD